jgi:hypothetical protein
MNRLLEILKPLKRISPSRYTAINRCPYRVVLANSYSSPLLPYPPANHLGNAIHKCIQLIITGKIRTAEEFDETWNRLLIKEEKKLEDMGFGIFIPLSENVSGYTIKKLQVKSLLKNRDKTKVQEDKNTDTKILSEKWLEAQDSLIGGYADIIITRNGYTKLSDFKSGKILLEEGEIKEEYEDQLKLYAYLYNQVFGKYPNELSIIDLEKKEYLINFTSQECEALARKSREALLKINNLIEMDERRALAKPTLDHCKSCLYRPGCDFYWDLSLSETESIFRDVRGKVAAVRQFRNGNLNATLITGGKELTVSQINGEYSPFLTEAVGKEVAFYNVKQGGMPERYQALKTTKVYEA